jgi:MarR family transcriptional regulator, transcriptional regulator for hemolysin
MNDDKITTSFGNLVSQTARYWRRVANLRLQPFGLTEATWLPLLRIARSPTPMHQKELAASLSLDNSSVVRLIDNLEKAGLVERREGEDRRAKEILLTEEGRKTVEAVERVARGIREEALALLPREDIETTWRVLDHISDVLARQLEEPEQ